MKISSKYSMNPKSSKNSLKNTNSHIASWKDSTSKYKISRRKAKKHWYLYSNTKRL